VIRSVIDCKPEAEIRKSRYVLLQIKFLVRIFSGAEGLGDADMIAVVKLVIVVPERPDQISLRVVSPRAVDQCNPRVGCSSKG